MSHYPKKYQKQATLGIIGLALVASPLILKLPFQFYAFNASNTVETSETIERTRIDQRKQTADKLKETGVLPTGDKLLIRDYYDNRQHNPNPSTTGYLEDETVFVYDSAHVCIGRIQARKWLWKHFYTNACKGSPAF